MKKQVQNVIIASVILALLIGILFFVLSLPADKKSDTSISEPSYSAEPFLKNSLDNISSVLIENNSGTFEIEVSTQGDNKTYNIPNLESSKTASQSSLEMFINQLINISPAQTVETDANNLKKYGLEPETSKITVKFKDNTNKIFKLGNQAPLSIGTYLRFNNEKTVYLISIPDAEIFLNSKDFYIEESKK